MKPTLPLLFLLFLVLGRVVAQNDGDCARPEALGNNLFAGIDLGSTGMKPVVFQLSKKEDGRVIFRKVSQGLNPDNSIEFSKDRSPQNMICYAKRLAEYVTMFQNPLYQIPSERIYFLMSAGFIQNFKDDSHAFQEVKEIIRQYNPDISLAQLTNEQESEYIIRAVTIDGVLDEPNINIIDIGGRTLKGGYLNNKGKIEAFSVETGPSGLAKEIEKTVAEKAWKVDNPEHRRMIAEYASQYFRDNYLAKIKINKTRDNLVVLSGGIPYVYASWNQTQDVANRNFIKIFADDQEADDFVEQAIANPNNKDLFKNGKGASTIIDYFGQKIYDNSQTIYKDVKLLAGAVILRDLCKDLRENKGSNLFMFNNDMMYSHLYYHIYLQQK